MSEEQPKPAPVEEVPAEETAQTVPDGDVSASSEVAPEATTEAASTAEGESAPAEAEPEAEPAAEGASAE